MGIDTPESRTSDPVEKIFGLAAKERVKHLLGAESTLISKVKGDGNEEMRGKFGRILGDFTLNDGDTLTSKLMSEGHAVAYNGGNKEKIQPKHVENRNRLVSEGKVDMQGLEVTKPGTIGTNSNLVILTNIDENGKVVDHSHKQAKNDRANQQWHSDSSFKIHPAHASILNGRTTPKIGGSTQFMCMRNIYNKLDQSIQKQLDNLDAIHHFAHSRSKIDPTMVSPVSYTHLRAHET